MNEERKKHKFDEGKLKYSLIDTLFQELIADILTKGEVNHPAVQNKPSWQQVEPEAYYNAMMRHIQEYRKDPSAIDADMSTHHMGHVAVNAMFLYVLDRLENEQKEE